MSSFRTLNQSGGGYSNPAKKFLEWKSNDNCFSYYDKEKGENVKVELPLQIQFLEHFHTVKGWHDASQSGIYANEVKFTGKDILKVKSFKGGTIAEGLYSEIRSKVRDAGGKYHRSVYALINGEIVNLQFKGAVVSAYSEFCKENEAAKFESNFIVIKEFKTLKKGATKYSVPVFEVGNAYTATDLQPVISAYKVITDYYNNYTAGQTATETTPLDDVDDDLDY